MSRMGYRRRSVLLPVPLFLCGLFAWVFVPGPSDNPTPGYVWQLHLPRIAASPGSGTKAIDATARFYLQRAGPLIPVVEVVNVTLFDGSGPILTTDPRYREVAEIASSTYTECGGLEQQWIVPKAEWSITASDVDAAIRTGQAIRPIPTAVLKLCGLVLTISASLWIGTIFVGNRRYDHAVSRGLCLVCGYSIGTLAVCPECGRSHDVYNDSKC